MDGATLQARVYYGYTQAAQRIGLSFDQYRPTSAVNALSAGYKLRSLPASFNVQDMKYGKVSAYGKAVWFCLADGRLLAPGDYLTGNGFTYFIAAMEPLLPIAAVLCNRVVNVYRPQQEPGLGAVAYGGNTAGNQTAIVTTFPASILLSTKAEKGPVNLPGDVRSGWATLLLPLIPGGVTIMNHDVVTDDLGGRYVISSAELSELGWRINMMEAET
jgi:hypothetical protein